MIRTVLLRSALGIASLLVPAVAAAQIPPAAYPPPAPPPPPMSTDAVAVPMAPPGGAAGAAPMAMVPKSPDDMGGSIGFGIGIIPNAQLVGTTGIVGIKAWLSNSVALAPTLGLGYSKPKDVDATWSFRPEAVVLFAPFKSTSTRFELGAGVGLSLSKDAPSMLMPTTDTLVDIYIPLQAGVEHFFARWFSMGIAASMRIIEYRKQGEANQFDFSIDSTRLLGQLFFYTD
jgi:hypothetical protein